MAPCVADHDENKLKAIFLPFPSQSHLIPVTDIGRLFARHGVDVTILTTPANAAIVQPSLDREVTRGCDIRTHVVPFPSSQVGLPPGMEAINFNTPPDMSGKIFRAMSILKDDFQRVFNEFKPDFIVTDMFFPWTVDAAEELGIPRLIYVGGGYFANSCVNSIQQCEPHKTVDSDTEPFLLPGLPHKVEMTRLQIPDWLKEPNWFTYMMKPIKDSERRSYGSLLNSFYELEGAYEDYYKKAMGTKSWSLGPISSWVNQDASDISNRGHFGKKEEQEDEELLKWLDSKTEDSVLYVSFGSMNKFPTPQLVEIAHALEDSGIDFIWVVRKVEEEKLGEEENSGNSFLKEFEKRARESRKGYLIWGWAPQLLILEHPATGGVMTHCGRNTIMESVNAALPMAAWPLFEDQFYNEKLLVHVLRIGVAVGAKKWRTLNDFGDEVIKREDIGKAITVLMGRGEEALEMRNRVKALSLAAKKAVQVGGSSYNNLLELIQELKSVKLQKLNNHKIEEQTKALGGS